ncbi:MAG: DoxX family protein [Chloroflexota bacterium]|nr:DoxX family protein [Chloroflexota bacterium]
MNEIQRGQVIVMEDPSFWRTLTSDTRWAWVWLPLRLYLAYTFIESGTAKLTNPAWMQTGTALRGFWQNAVAIGAHPVITYDWYRSFIQEMLGAQAYVWFAKVVAVGETTVGIALLLGAFTGIAAFTGGFLSWNFIMAGTASVNALVFAIATWLVLAWKTAGWIGVDRWLLPALGTPWHRGHLARTRMAHEQEREERLAG